MAYLPSLFASLGEQSVLFRTIVVDNASDDGTLEWISKQDTHATVLRNTRNLGFASAHNQAISLAFSRWPRADRSFCYILICNPDIVLDSSCLATMIQYMDTHPETDAVAPKLLRARFSDEDGEFRDTERLSQIDAVGIALQRNRTITDLGAGESDDGQYEENRLVFGASGACVCYRASSLERACVDGQFYDERFFAYQEDVDVAWRLQRMGMKTVYLSTARAWHHRRVPADEQRGWMQAFLERRKRSPFVNFLSTRNHVWLLAKHLSWSDLFLDARWILPYETAKLFASFTSFSSLRGYFFALRDLPFVLKQRRVLRSVSCVSPAEIRRQFL